MGFSDEGYRCKEGLCRYPRSVHRVTTFRGPSTPPASLTSLLTFSPCPPRPKALVLYSYCTDRQLTLENSPTRKTITQMRNAGRPFPHPHTHPRMGSNRHLRSPSRIRDAWHEANRPLSLQPKGHPCAAPSSVVPPPPEEMSAVPLRLLPVPHRIRWPHAPLTPLPPRRVPHA